MAYTPSLSLTFLQLQRSAYAIAFCPSSVSPYIPQVHSEVIVVWVSIYSVIVGLKIGVVVLKIDKKWCCGVKDQRN